MEASGRNGYTMTRASASVLSRSWCYSGRSPQPSYPPPRPLPTTPSRASWTACARLQVTPIAPVSCYTTLLALPLWYLLLLLPLLPQVELQVAHGVP
eukprot:5989478-Pleurochrysis_carterae.AAC.1